MIQDHDAVFVIFSEPQVRLCKTAHFLKTFGRDVLPHGPELAAMMGKFQFLVEGWNEDPQELYSIPEVRKFYQHFHRVWPYWFFFCDLHTETLTMMTLCLMPNIRQCLNINIIALGGPRSKCNRSLRHYSVLADDNMKWICLGVPHDMDLISIRHGQTRSEIPPRPIEIDLFLDHEGAVPLTPIIPPVAELLLAEGRYMKRIATLLNPKRNENTLLEFGEMLNLLPSLLLFAQEEMRAGAVSEINEQI